MILFDRELRVKPLTRSGKAGAIPAPSAPELYALPQDPRAQGHTHTHSGLWKISQQWSRTRNGRGVGGRVEGGGLYNPKQYNPKQKNFVW